ncbi:MAG: hypothetical protein OEZ34_07825 [Spirochaetia bacterium]|nr:hypothetical protein [Spirochaetia bacterium]
MDDFENNASEADYLPRKYDEELLGRKSEAKERQISKKKKKNYTSEPGAGGSLDALVSVIALIVMLGGIIAGGIAFLYSWIMEFFI